MTLMRWDPFREIAEMQRDIDRLMNRGSVRPSCTVAAWGQWMQPSLDVFQKPKEVVVKASLPGVEPDNVEVSITGDALTIKAETKAEEQVEEEDYMCRECHCGSYFRSVVLPHGLTSDKATASFDDGVLTLTIPRETETKPKVIEVKAKEATKGEKTSKKKSAPKKKAKKKTEAK
jgi:HSP20 family protein